MAQSQVLHVEQWSSERIDPDTLEDAESVMDAVDLWVARGERLGCVREYKVRKTVLGHVAVLFDRGAPASSGKGRGSVNALADALGGLK